MCGEGDVQFSFSTSASHDVMMKELEDLLAEAVALQEVAPQEVALQVALQEDEMSQVPSRRAATLLCIDTSCSPSSACDMRHAYKVCSSPMRCAGVVLTCMASMSALPLQKKTPSPRRLRLR